MNDLVALRGRQVDSRPKDLVEMLWAAARDSPTLLNPCLNPWCFTRSPSFICTFRRAAGGAAVWIAHILLAGGRALAPESLLLTLVGTIPVDVALGVPSVLLAGFVCLASLDRVLTRLWARFVEAVFIHSLILTALLQCHPILVTLHTLRWTCWLVVTAVGIALVLEADPRTFILAACSSLATGFAGGVVAGGHLAVLLARSFLHLVLEGLCTLGGARQIAFLSVTILLTFWLSISRHVSRLAEGGAWAVAVVEVGVL